MSNVYLTRIRLEQYRSFRNLDIRLRDGPGVLVVHGSNGIGKSSLFDALEWALTDSIDHFRDADGVKKVGRYLCRWRDGAPGPTSVSMDFSNDKVVSRTLSSAEATKSRRIEDLECSHRRCLLRWSAKIARRPGHALATSA
jgi:exonuclease SbcC